MKSVIDQVTERIVSRSEKLRAHYLSRLEEARIAGPHRTTLQCGNLAHGFAACNVAEKNDLKGIQKPNIAIVSAYNDLLSAHKPYETFPDLLKQAIKEAGGVAQFAGGVPAMCDGITQGQPGMELSLMSRDVIALAASIALSHNLFDGGLMLGICDKIVPGLLIAALSFGHIPFIFVPAGPMPSGISNLEKARIRELFSQGKADKEALLEAESASYHTKGTCTFYGTANSNQLLMEVMGLQLPGSSFVNPGTPLRDALTRASGESILKYTHLGDTYLPIGRLVEAKTIVNGMVGLLASGGSTNHTMHLVAIARAAGFIINWDDFSALSEVTPLIARIYPNGEADINHFQRAGGMSFFIRTLLEADLLHEAVHTVAGFGLAHYLEHPILEDDRLIWTEGYQDSKDYDVLRPASNPFLTQGGLRVLSGNLGRAIFKTSALPKSSTQILAPAVVFSTQEAVADAYKAGELNQDCVVVLRFQGPKACGMPELHQLTPMLSVLQQRGFKVGLLTDGRMSGASGKIPAAIHVTPEAEDAGLIAEIQTGDMILMDWQHGILELQCPEETLASRQAIVRDETLCQQTGMGRELFGALRMQLSQAEQGACSLFVSEKHWYE